MSCGKLGTPTQFVASFPAIASYKSKDGVSEPSIKLDICDKESEFVEYEINDHEEEKV